MAYVPSPPFADFDFLTVDSQEVLSAPVTELALSSPVALTQIPVASPTLVGGESIPFSYPVGG